MDDTTTERERTDESLRVERELADQELEIKRASDAALLSATAKAKNERAQDRLLREREERAAALAELLQQEREQTDQDLEAERAREDDALRSRDHFLGMVGHDLRSQIGGIAMCAATLRRIPDDEPAGYRDSVHQQVARLQRYAAQMHRLVVDLLDVAHIHAGQLKIFPRQVEANALLLETVQNYQALATARGTRLEARVAPHAVMTELDRERVLQVLDTLVRNAIQVTQNGGVVSAGVEVLDQQLRFSVLDTGPGIQEDDVDAIFEGRWSVSTPERRALGLGLYISKCIVEAHGGLIWVDSKPGAGTLFLFTVPNPTPRDESPATP